MIVEVDEIMASVPDLGNWEPARLWVADRLDLLRRTAFDPALRTTFAALEAPPPASFDAALGPYGSPKWRRFALAAFLADWACYEKPAHRVGFTQLMYVTSVFPAGFRVWMCRWPDGSWVPVGYTGWYPLAEPVYLTLAKSPASANYRGAAVPLRTLAARGNYLFLFNYSIVAPLKTSPESRMMMKSFAEQLATIDTAGMAAVTVSEDGSRVARRFGLQYAGDMVAGGNVGRVFTSP